MRACLALLPLLIVPSAFAQDAAPAPRVSWEANARLRYEHVDDDAFVRTANVTTLRLRAGLRAQLATSLEALVEGEAVGALGDDYNSGANRQVAYPVVADPEGVELNQAWLRWHGSDASVAAGRQRLLFDNQRWIGNVGWRQNEQTFDALSAQWSPSKALALRYAWLDRVHRVSGDKAVDRLARERDLDAHLVNAVWAHGPHRVAGYGYLVEDQDVAAASTATWGARYTLAPVKDGRPWGLTVEAARQQDHADNPLSFRHDYWLVEPSIALRGTTMRAGWEHLGGNGRHALQTPLATLHAFNGWADKFGTTPAAGLEDRYLGAGGRFGGERFDWQVTWHDYRADAGNARYGREWDASLGFPVHGKVRGLAKLADYRADGFARDTTKAWLQLEWSR